MANQFTVNLKIITLNVAAIRIFNLKTISRFNGSLPETPLDLSRTSKH